jgi:hypothetical protein
MKIAAAAILVCLALVGCGGSSAHNSTSEEELFLSKSQKLHLAEMMICLSSGVTSVECQEKHKLEYEPTSEFESRSEYLYNMLTEGVNSGGHRTVRKVEEECVQAGCP